MIQEKQRQNVLSIREQEKSDPEIKQWVKDNFQQLCTIVYTYWKIKTSYDQNPIQQRFQPNSTKGRRILVNLQERVEGGIKQADEPKHIIKLDKCSDRQFIKPLVKTLKKDQTV